MKSSLEVSTIETKPAECIASLEQCVANKKKSNYNLYKITKGASTVETKIAH